MLKLDDIIQLIEKNQTPTWILSARKNQYSNALTFKGNYIPEGDAEENIDKSVARLKEQTAILINEDVYCYSIDCKYKKTSSKSGINTYEFVLKETPVNNNQNNQQQVQGLNGIPEGYATLGQLSAMIETERSLGQVKLQEALLARDRAEFERYKQDEKNRIEEQKKYFNSDAQKAAKGFWILGNAIFSNLVKDAPAALGNVEIRDKELPGMDNDELTESERIAADISETLADTYKTPEEMKKMQFFIETFIKQQKNPTIKETIINEKKTEDE